MSGPDKRCTWFNQRWLDFVGRAIEQELGDGWCDNLHPADFDRVLDTYHAAFDARRPYEMEFRLQRDDGAWRWLLERGTPNFGPSGDFEGFLGTCIDITEHRETVEALRESRARFKTLTESLPQMIWTCTRDGYCDYLSRQWIDYTGRSESQQLGRGWLEQVHPDDRVKVEMEWARVVGSGDAFDVSFRIRRFDGAVSMVQDTRHPVTRSGGPHPQVVRLEHRHRGLRQCQQSPRGAARAHAAARSHHACHRRSPGSPQGFRSRAAQPRRESRRRLRLYLPLPVRAAATHRGLRRRTQPGAGARDRAGRARADRAGRRPAGQLPARRAGLRSDDRRPVRALPQAARRRRAALAGLRTAADREQRGVRRAAGGQARGGLLQQRRPRIPAAAVQPRGAGRRTRRGCTTRSRRPTRTCARPSRP